MHAEAEKLSTEAKVGAVVSGRKEPEMETVMMMFPVLPAISQAFDFCLGVGSETETLLKKRSARVTFIWMVRKGQLNRWAQ